MSMSKKDFIALADVIQGMEPIAISEIGMAQKAQWTFMRDRLADFCQHQNPRFNRERWLDYIAGRCGKNGGKIKA